MQVLMGTASVPPGVRGGALAIGNFDGVHRGHQALVAEVLEHAGKLLIPAGVMVFEPHPREFFQPAEPHFRLTPLPLKLAAFESLGLDFVAVHAFDAAFAALDAERFIEDELVRPLAPRHVVIGYDFFFGRKRAGTPQTMLEAGRRFGFGVTVVEPVAEDGEVFSSTAIRLALAQGDVRHATASLGRYWRVTGKVVGGARRGTGLGFPTANIALDKGVALAHGIYAVWVEAAGAQNVGERHLVERHMGAAYLGTRPTFDDGAPLLEVFLLDFDGDLYGREIAVDFVDFVRADRKFDDVDELKAQMRRDCEHVHEILSADTV